MLDWPHRGSPQNENCLQRPLRFRVDGEVPSKEASLLESRVAVLHLLEQSIRGTQPLEMSMWFHFPFVWRTHEHLGCILRHKTLKQKILWSCCVIRSPMLLSRASHISRFYCGVQKSLRLLGQPSYSKNMGNMSSILGPQCNISLPAVRTRTWRRELEATVGDMNRLAEMLGHRTEREGKRVFGRFGGSLGAVVPFSPPGSKQAFVPGKVTRCPMTLGVPDVGKHASCLALLPCRLR